MESKLITNQDLFLDEVIDNILPAAKNLYFLVGYFYFSGFEKLLKKSERMVYRLYDLTHEEIKILEWE